MIYIYLAGFIDGDGHFHVGMEWQKKNKIFAFSYSIQIVSVYEEIMKFFTENFGGYSGKKPERSKRKTQHIWTLKSKKSLPITEKILPFLTDKKITAQLYLQLIISIVPNCGAKICKDVLDFRQKIIYQIKKERNMNDFVTKENIESLKQISRSVEPTEENFAYLAGLIDAEGCFSIKHWKPKDRKNRDYVISLQIGNTRIPIFKWLLERFAGTVHYYEPNKRRVKPIATWHITSKALNDLLPKIYPFLRIKKERCKKLMEFYETNTPLGGNRHSEAFKLLSNEIQSKRAKLIEEIHLLNARGKHT